MATYESSTYERTLFSDAGNLNCVRLTHSGQLANGDVVKIGKLPPFSQPMMALPKLTNYGSATVSLKVGEKTYSLSDGDLTHITDYPASESEEADISIVVGSADTGSSFEATVDFFFTVVQN